MKTDATDGRILEALRENARISHVDLAERVGLSATACARRIRLLEEAGVIRGYTTIRDHAAVSGRRPLFVQVRLSHPTAENMRKFETSLRSCPQVRECFLVTGDADYLLRLEISEMDDFETVHTDVLSRLPGVASLVTSVTIRSVFSYL